MHFVIEITGEAYPDDCFNCMDSWLAPMAGSADVDTGLAEKLSDFPKAIAAIMEITDWITAFSAR